MKNAFFITLLTFLSPSLIFAQSKDDPIVVRLNGIYVDEISFLGLSDPAIGTTAEVALMINESDGAYQSIGLESGHITARMNDALFPKFEIDLIPIFVNYTIGGDIGESVLIWEAGIGLGGISINVDDPFGNNDDDFVLGGQIFGSFGQKVTENCSLLAGIRYMTSGEADIFADFGVREDEILSSIAVDLSLNFSF
jgi:hypothetical protein